MRHRTEEQSGEKRRPRKGFERWTIVRRANRMNADPMFNDTPKRLADFSNVSMRCERETIE